MNTLYKSLQRQTFSFKPQSLNIRPQFAMTRQFASSSPMRSSSTQSPIAIIGAGPAGLMLARLLDMSKIPYTIFERDETHDNRQGSGTLDVRPATGQLALREAGLLDKFNAAARHGVDTRIVDSQAKVLIKLGGENDKERPEIDRQDLQRILQESVPLDHIRWNSKIEKFSKASDGSVGIHMADGKVESGFRLVVGADGAWSKVRRDLFTSEKPRYTGVTFFTTYIKPEDSIYDAAASLTEQGNYLAMNGMEKIFLHYLGDRSYFFSVGVNVSEAESQDKTILQSASTLWKALLAKRFADWTPQLTDLIKQSRGDFRAWPFYNAQLPTWEPVSGATLMGDAAHLTVPTGEGVNNAMFDGLELAKLIVKHGVDNIDQAVVEYEAGMLPRAVQAIHKGEFMADKLFGSGAPDSFFKAVGIEV